MGDGGEENGEGKEIAELLPRPSHYGGPFCGRENDDIKGEMSMMVDRDSGVADVISDSGAGEGSSAVVDGPGPVYGVGPCYLHRHRSRRVARPVGVRQRETVRLILQALSDMGYG